MKAADVMATNIITVCRDMPFTKIAEVLLANRISAVPVVNDEDAWLAFIQALMNLGRDAGRAG